MHHALHASKISSMWHEQSQLPSETLQFTHGGVSVTTAVAGSGVQGSMRDACVASARLNGRERAAATWAPGEQEQA